MRRRMFLQIDATTMFYPVLEFVPALLPVCWVWRLVPVMATKLRKDAYQL